MYGMSPRRLARWRPLSHQQGGGVSLRTRNRDTNVAGNSQNAKPSPNLSQYADESIQKYIMGPIDSIVMHIQSLFI